MTSRASIIELGKDVSLDRFVRACRDGVEFELADGVAARISSDAEAVKRHAFGDQAIYGLNTGLGGNLGHRLKPEEISAHQMRILAGRAVAVGKNLPEWAGRGIGISRLISAVRGGSGMSQELFTHLVKACASVNVPKIPRHGSIGASDLAQNAVWALEILGQGQVSIDDPVPELGPRDAMALINHGGLTITASAIALIAIRDVFEVAKQALLLSYMGYGAHQGVLSEELDDMRIAPQQSQIAGWLRDRLGDAGAPRRPQEALSFRTAHLILATAQDAISRAIDVATSELNGSPDSPVVLEDGSMMSTANFAAPALAHALESVALALVPVAVASGERAKRMMTPELSGLPKYLSPAGGASAGFVPLQKTMAALVGEVRTLATPLSIVASPVSDGVEDVAPMTLQSALKLHDLVEPLKLLMACESLVACQAIDLRGTDPGPHVGAVHKAIRAHVPMLEGDRPIGADIDLASHALLDFSKSAN